jgi:hypothetical protein
MALNGPTYKDCYFSTDGLGLMQKPYYDRLKKEKRLKEYLLKDMHAS